MITNTDRNHPAAIVVTTRNEGDNHIPTTEHPPSEIDTPSLQKTVPTTDRCSSGTKEITLEHTDDNLNIGEAPEVISLQQQVQHEVLHEQQLLNETSEQSNASSVASAISVLTPQGAVIRQQQEQELREQPAVSHQRTSPLPPLPKEREVFESPTPIAIDPRQRRIIQSVTQSIIRTIRESATTNTNKLSSSTPQQPHNATKWYQNHDIITQTIPLFHFPLTSTSPLSVTTKGNYSAVQQLYIDLQRHYHSWTMMGITVASNNNNRNDSTILDQWTTTICQGITTPDINATVTHALLSALYTLIEEDDSTHTLYQRYSDQIINAVINCAFEETNTSSSIDSTTIHSSNSQRNVLIDQHEKKGGTTTTTTPASTTPTASTGTVSRRRASTMSIPTPSATNDREPPPARKLPPGQSSFYESKSALGSSANQSSTTTTEDELAVYQLIQLILLLGNTWKSQGTEQQHHHHIIGLLDMCWHIHTKTQQIAATSRLLQQKAMDAELHIIQSILLCQCFETKSTVVDHVLNRVSSSFLLLTRPTTTAAIANNAKASLPTTSAAAVSQDVTCIEPPLGTMSPVRVGGSNTGLHNNPISTKHCILLIKVVIRWMELETTFTESSLTSTVIILLGPVLRNVITVAMYTNQTTELRNCIEIVDEFVLIFGLERLKCEFEVFLLTVLLRRLVCAETTETNSVPIAEKEIVLDYLQQLCFAAHTASSSASVSILDIYINYDCDCHCTNVFETMMSTLSSVARPSNWTASDINMAISSSSGNCDPDVSICNNPRMSTGGELSAATPKSNNVENTPSAINHLQRTAFNCILLAMELADQIATQDNFVIATSQSCARVHACDELMIHTKKTKKRSLDMVVRSFNTTNLDKGEWLNVAVKEGVLDSTNDPAALANLFFMVPMNIDKQRVGIYLSRGPESDFPFHAALRTQFVALFDFRNMSFTLALRKFLSKFRLPGEAQCIDRLMEVFSKEYFNQHRESSIFQNADAVFVLAFSTIMLNTDLHNPTIKADRRMTLEQFLRNNRGINDGDDLPDDYLTDLYAHIKDRELQLLTDMDQMTTNGADDNDSKTFWDAIDDQKGVVGATIRLSEEARRGGCKTLSKDLLVTTTLSYVPALVGIFVTSTDNMMIVSVLRAIKQLLTLASTSEMDGVINDVLLTLLAVGQNYISKHSSDEGSVSVALHFPTPSADQPRRKRNLSIDSVSMSEDILLGIERNQIPNSLLCSRTDSDESDDFAGCIEHRGILALDCCFVFIRNNTSRVNDAWPVLIKCLCMLRDIRALPKSLADLDDFADSSGHVLPLSLFALGSQKRLLDHHRAINDKENPKQKGWFRSLFRKSKIDDQVSDSDFNTTTEMEQSISAKALLGIAESSNIESIVQMGSSQIPDASIDALLEVLNQYPFEHDPVGEQHAIFTVELAARALLSHHERAENLFLIFLSKFERILCKATNVDGDIPDAPFIIERIVVTILRCCIHLYEYPKVRCHVALKLSKHAHSVNRLSPLALFNFIKQLRPHLRASLQLLTMTLPRSFLQVISNRMSCGLAIILRASYPYFEDQQEWSFMNDMLDALAHYETSRLFVFDGIASTVEYAMPNFNTNLNIPSSSCVSHEDQVHKFPPPPLSIEACNVLSRILIRFVLNYYHGDQSLMVPAMLCLEKVYRRKVELLLTHQHQHMHVAISDGLTAILPHPIRTSSNTSLDIVSNAPDPELWQNVAVAIYSVCRSPDPDASTVATKCFRRLVVRTDIGQIEHGVWVTMLFLMVHKQPTVMSEVSRANTFSVLGQLLLRIVPPLSHLVEYREDMEEFILQFAALAEENIQSSQSSCHHREYNDRDNVVTTSTMFDKTVQTLTYICNQILSDGWNGDREFSVWMNDALLNPLELASNLSNNATGRGHEKVVFTTFDNQNDLDDVSEISDSVAGEEY